MNTQSFPDFNFSSLDSPDFKEDDDQTILGVLEDIADRVGEDSWVLKAAG